MGAGGRAVGIDLGGTKIAAGVFDSSGALLGDLAVEPTLADGSAEGTTAALFSAIDQALDGASISPGDIAGIGVGTPGPLDSAAGTLLEVPTLPQLHYFPLRGTLAQRYETRIDITNDGNCFALGEARFGVARGEGVVLGITLGTGCGVGLVVDGRIHEGATCNAGEVYRALCGDKTFDDALSGPGLERLYLARCGEKKSGEELCALARGGDPSALAVFDDFATELARGLGILAAVVDPHVIVLGGSVAAAFDCFGQLLEERIGDYIAPAAAGQLRLVASERGFASGAAGAAALVFSGLGEEL